jgi:negative regulator of sigma E activity
MPHNFSRQATAAAIAGAVAAAMLAGCVSYTPDKLAAMSSVDLCDLQATQGVNLSADTKRALQGEVQRRNDSCGNYAAVIAQRRDEFLYREMYGKQDNP